MMKLLSKLRYKLSKIKANVNGWKPNPNNLSSNPTVSKKKPKYKKRRMLAACALMLKFYLASPKLTDSNSNTFSSAGTQISKLFINKNQIVQESLVSNQEFDKVAELKNMEGQVILVKTDGTPFFSLPGASGFTNTPPALNNRPNRLEKNNRPGINQNPVRTGPKLVNQGFGAAGNPGGEGGNPDFDENGQVSDKEESQKSHPYDYSLNNELNKKKKAEQCDLKETAQERKKREEECQRIEENLRKNGKQVTVAIRHDGYRCFLEHKQIRLKAYHFDELNIPFPKSFDIEHAKKLNQEGRKKELEEYCMNPKILSDEFIQNVAEGYKKHLMDPENIVIHGTINAKRSENLNKPHFLQSAVHIVNTKTKFNIIFNDGNRYVSSWKLNKKQLDELFKTGNLM